MATQATQAQKMKTDLNVDTMASRFSKHYFKSEDLDFASMWDIFKQWYIGPILNTFLFHLKPGIQISFKSLKWMGHFDFILRPLQFLIHSFKQMIV